ncbi:hypothetical protein X943_001662 [Babesia divergens]|uniref:Uncharacterized protein n=1 Tax=Babesia divergens TaxID=32595 RepID=A0AAD9LHS8_BABDI|nr:hypothetical protein X943_001662 [Babesia divergens]
MTLSQNSEKCASMPSQSILPLAGKQEATESILEGSVITTRLNTHGLFKFLGNIPPTIGLIKIPGVVTPLDKAFHSGS